ncbi:methylamine utilization protein [Silanimonas algicola]
MVVGVRLVPSAPAVACALLLGLLPAALSAALRVDVRSGGQPVASAVVTLTPIGRAAAVVPVDAVMDQVNSEFQPRVLVVTKGSRVRFPNSDTIRHQVYSFSAAKRFELPLYTGTPPEPVVFDRAGVVTLGCNIHDWMKGYVVILDTPYHAVTGADGRVTLDAPDGAYLLTAWHERLPALDAAPKVSITLPMAGPTTLDLPLAPPPPPRGTDRLRALQDKFRNPPRD